VTVNVNLNANLNAQADLLLLVPTYTFESPVLGGQLALSMMGVFGRNSVGIDGTLTTGIGLIVTTRTGSMSDSLVSAGKYWPARTGTVSRTSCWSGCYWPETPPSISRLASIFRGGWIGAGPGAVGHWNRPAASRIRNNAEAPRMVQACWVFPLLAGREKSAASMPTTYRAPNSFR
jgi:hypothetical protein